MFLKFAEAGIKTMGFDQRGFGKTIEVHGKKGHSQGIDNTFADIKAIGALVREQGKPHFGMGQSMGGGLILGYASQFPEDLDGVIALCIAFLI